jgi:TrmH family RNA methyltransferase
MSDAPRPGVFRKITSFANPLVKELRALHERKRRDESGLFLAEGLKLVRDAVENGWRIETLAYGSAQSCDPQVGRLAARAKASGGPVLEVSAAVLEKITRRDNPQTVVGAFRQHLAPEYDIGAGGLWVALDRVRDPGNLGTIMRTADAAGCAGVALVGATCDPFALEAVRATMGSIFHVPIARTTEDGFLAQVRRRGARLLGTHLTAEAVDYREIDYRAPLILLMGNEQSGLTERLSAACEALARIPMPGKADSLNLAVSTGIMIYEALRARGGAAPYTAEGPEDK